MAEIHDNATGGITKAIGEITSGTSNSGVTDGARNKWHYFAVALVGGMIGGALAGRLAVAIPAIAAANPAGASESPAKSIAAQEIVLVDTKGKPHALLQLNGASLPIFRIYDNAGKNRLGIGFGQDGLVGLDMADQKGTERILLSVNSDGLTALRLFDDAARLRMLLGIDSEGEPAIDFYDHDGKLMRELP